MKLIILIILSCFILVGCATVQNTAQENIWRSPLSSLPSVSGGETKRVSNVVRLEPGELKVMADIQDCGVIHQMWLTAMQNSELSLRELVL